MAKLAECANKHQYDPSKHAACPHCRDADKTIEGTAPLIVAPPILDGKTEPLGQDHPIDEHITEVGYGLLGKDGIRDNTVREIQPFNPVVGWLVVLEGEYRGRDFRLTAGTNTVGRSRSQDVSVEVDPRMSESHCTVRYLSEANEFDIEDHSRHGTFLNGKTVRVRTLLQNNDRVKAGNTVFLVRLLCDDNFQWEVNS